MEAGLAAEAARQEAERAEEVALVGTFFELEQRLHSATTSSQASPRDQVTAWHPLSGTTCLHRLFLSWRGPHDLSRPHALPRSCSCSWF